MNDKFAGNFSELISSFKTYLRQEYDTGLKEAKLQPSSQRCNELELWYEEIRDCQRCLLSKTRINLVFGDGNPDADLMFVGEGPGFNEDREGKPFVGKAGQLLTKIIQAIGFSRADVYITNIVKCHPLKDVRFPENRGNDRPPKEEEIASCLPILKKQIDIIAPKIICALGSVATQTLLNTKGGIQILRGRFYKISPQTVIIPTYHPAALLRNPSLKRAVWEDMKMIMKELNK